MCVTKAVANAKKWTDISKPFVKGWVLLGCESVPLAQYFLTSWRLLPPFSNANNARTVVLVLRTLKMTAMWSFETPGSLGERNSVMTQKIWIFNKTAVRTSHVPTNLLLFASDSLVDKRKIECSADCGSYPWLWAHTLLIRYTSELTGTWLPRALYVTPRKRICRLKLDKIYRMLWRQATVDFVFLDTW